jgi:hypothetical protein
VRWTGLADGEGGEELDKDAAESDLFGPGDTCLSGGAA